MRISLNGAKASAQQVRREQCLEEMRRDEEIVAQWSQTVVNAEFFYNTQIDLMTAADITLDMLLDRDKMTQHVSRLYEQAYNSYKSYILSKRSVSRGFYSWFPAFRPKSLSDISIQTAREKSLKILECLCRLTEIVPEMADVVQDCIRHQGDFSEFRQHMPDNLCWTDDPTFTTALLVNGSASASAELTTAVVVPSAPAMADVVP